MKESGQPCRRCQCVRNRSADSANRCAGRFKSALYELSYILHILTAIAWEAAHRGRLKRQRKHGQAAVSEPQVAMHGLSGLTSVFTPKGSHLLVIYVEFTDIFKSLLRHP